MAIANCTIAIGRTQGGASDAKKQSTQTIAEEWKTDLVWVSGLARAFYQFTGTESQSGRQIAGGCSVDEQNFVRRTALCCGSLTALFKS